MDMYDKLLENTANNIIENNLEGICMDDVDLHPCNATVIVAPYDVNPYRRVDKTESGLIIGIESDNSYKSNETGEIEQNKEVIKCGKVIAVGPACKNVKVGEDVFFTTYSMTPVPFRKMGYVAISETLLISRIVKHGKRGLKNFSIKNLLGIR